MSSEVTTVQPPLTIATAPAEVNALVLAEANLPPDQARQDRIGRLAATLDGADSNAILAFGTAAQARVTAVADSMLEGVRNKDTGAASGALSEMVATLRGFDPGDAAKEERSFFDRLLGRAKPVAKVLARYEDVRSQIEGATDKLERHKTQLMTDVATLDRLYAETLAWFHDLADHIAAGDQALAKLDADVIPKLDAEAAGSDMLAAQRLRDLRGRRDELERRVHDLKLTRQVAMQALPSIRVVQENDKSLVAKITSTVLNTVPLWKNQLSLAVAIARAREAGGDLKAATDLSNQLLTANADALRQSNAEIRTQVERGVFDIEAVKAANAQLIATIEDSLKIAADGKRMRAEAETTLVGLESELKTALRSAQATARGTPPAQPSAGPAGG